MQQTVYRKWIFIFPSKLHPSANLITLSYSFMGEAIIPWLIKYKDVHIIVADEKHSPTEDQLANAYVEIFSLLDNL